MLELDAKFYIFFIFYLTLKTTTLLQLKVDLIKIYRIDAFIIAVVMIFLHCRRYILRILLKILISEDLKFEVEILIMDFSKYKNVIKKSCFLYF
jgi:hypothetical protein